MSRGNVPLFVPLYLAFAWPAWALADHWAGFLSAVSFRVPELGDEPAKAISTILVAPFFNHSLDQLVYTTAFLLLFGLRVEAQIGPARTFVAFMGTTFAAAVIGSAFLHAVYPDVFERDPFAQAWNREYSGGSAGALGLAGVFAALSARPLLWLAAFVAWELGLGYFYLENFTPGFHIAALLTGFVATAAARRSAAVARWQHAGGAGPG